jgi:hypothetical protein
MDERSLEVGSGSGRDEAATAGGAPAGAETPLGGEAGVNQDIPAVLGMDLYDMGRLPDDRAQAEESPHVGAGGIGSPELDSAPAGEAPPPGIDDPLSRRGAEEPFPGSEAPDI